MPTTSDKSEAEPAPSKPAHAEPPDVASAPLPETLADLRCQPPTPGSRAGRWKPVVRYGYNEVAEQKAHPVLKFLGKFWGISAWMLELIMVLSAMLENIPTSLW